MAETSKWARIVTDAAVIVASILLAFVIDAWWGERKERREEAEVLDGLHREFEEYRRVLEVNIAQHAETMAALADILRSIDAGTWVSNRWTIDEAVAMSLRPHTTELGNGVRDALAQGGRLQLISDRALRERLATWPGFYTELYDDQLNGRQMVMTQLLPYLTAHGYPLSRVSSLSSPGVRWPVTTQSIATDPAVARKLLTDPEYRALIEIRYVFWLHARGEYENALQAAKLILADLERVRS